jgi:hypothetical protein
LHHFRFSLQLYLHLVSPANTCESLQFIIPPKSNKNLISYWLMPPKSTQTKVTRKPLHHRQGWKSFGKEEAEIKKKLQLSTS